LFEFDKYPFDIDKLSGVYSPHLCGMKNKVWYITGASKGLGLALVKKLLAAGYRVAATSRNKSALETAVGETDSKNFLALEVDLTNAESIQKSVEQAHEYFGGLDIVVNNAGYGIGGSAEELSIDEIRGNFEINVFATITVVHSALPFMRAQRSGHIINISSIAGFTSTTGWSLYNAAKFAVTGFTEALAGDVAELGIKATVVMPGAFRTQFLNGESLFITNNHIDDYQAVHATHERFKTMDGKQAGDPEKAATVFIALAENPEPPVRLFLVAMPIAVQPPG
jgi:NAD(P)-dependent dehydrogenase (short-subunit alcohol dehydrogenase family)